MMDENFMRGWNDGHGHFSVDVDRGIAKLAGAISRLRRRRDSRDSDLRKRIGIV